MRSRNEPSQREAVGDASRMGLPARGDAYCESADDTNDPRALCLGKGDDLLVTRVKEGGGDGGGANEARRGGETGRVALMCGFGPCGWSRGSEMRDSEPNAPTLPSQGITGDLLPEDPVGEPA